MRKIICILFMVCLVAAPSLASGPVSKSYSGIYDPGMLTPIDSELKVAVGEMAPDFALTSISGKTIRLSSFKGKSNVVLSFIPAAWTPVCSGQWPGYNIAKDEFAENNAVLLGISVDNIATLYAWTQEMGGLWFEVLSDFWPHGAVADSYGLLRSDGTAERALVFIDKEGTIAAIHVENINVRPPLEYVLSELEKFPR